MDKTNTKEIFFHVGLAKTGTTFLQYRVFPKFEGICYIQRTRYQRALKLVGKSRHTRIFLSNEFDLLFEEEMRKFGAAYPHTTPIIVFRRHDGYIASQYRRFVKNGCRGTFRDFFDIDEDKGIFKKKNMEYMRHIRILEENFKTKPYVLFFEDMRDNPEKFILRLAGIMNVRIDMKRVKLKRKHPSYSEKQLRAVMFVGKYINLQKKHSCRNVIVRFLCRLPQNMVRYPTLWIGSVIPARYYSDTPLIPPEELEKVREYYKADWEACRRYAEESFKL